LASSPTKSLIVTAEFNWAAHFSCRISLASNPHNSLILPL